MVVGARALFGNASTRKRGAGVPTSSARHLETVSGCSAIARHHRLPPARLGRGAGAGPVVIVVSGISADAEADRALCMCGQVAVSLIGGELVEPCGLAVILRQAATTCLVEEPKSALSVSVSLVCRQFEKACGSRIVLRHTLAFYVKEPETVLSIGLALIGCLSKPTRRSRVVLRDVDRRRDGPDRASACRQQRGDPARPESCASS